MDADIRLAATSVVSLDSMRRARVRVAHHGDVLCIYHTLLEALEASETPYPEPELPYALQALLDLIAQGYTRPEAAAALRAYLPGDDLGAAWAEAEAALPAYSLLRVNGVPGWPKYGQEPYAARIEWWADRDNLEREEAYGPSPAAALRALTARLKEADRD